MVHDHAETIMYLSIKLNSEKMGLFSQCARDNYTTRVHSAILGYHQKPKKQKMISSNSASF